MTEARILVFIPIPKLKPKNDRNFRGRNDISKEEIYLCTLTLLGIFSALKSLKKLKKNLGRKGIGSNSNTKSGPCLFFPDTSTRFRFSILKPSFGHRLALSMANDGKKCQILFVVSMKMMSSLAPMHAFCSYKMCQVMHMYYWHQILWAAAAPCSGSCST